MNESNTSEPLAPQPEGIKFTPINEPANPETVIPTPQLPGIKFTPLPSEEPPTPTQNENSGIKFTPLPATEGTPTENSPTPPQIKPTGIRGLLNRFFK